METTEDDPADFLLTNTQYHDCHLTVGDPDVDTVERIGVSSSQLIAHSSVFRGMLVNSKLADPSGVNTHIKDVSPATFKLMLRHVYGGKLPKMTSEEAAQLALCADKYNIQRLVENAAKHINPTSAANGWIFTALTCVAYINCPSLELKVSEIIQQQTDQVCQNPKFLQLDENCMLFIVKQSRLNINELQLWNNIIRWGENQVTTQPEKSLRDCLNKILLHVRLLSLTSSDIVDHVLPKKVLTPEEFVDLTLAVTEKQALQSPGLCNVQEKREDSDKRMEYDFDPLCFNNSCSTQWSQLKSRTHSTVTIKPKVNVEIKTLTLRGIEVSPDTPFNSYELVCYIAIMNSSDGALINSQECETFTTMAVPSELIVLQVKKTDGNPLTLEANGTYHMKLETYPALPVHKFEKTTFNYEDHKQVNAEVKSFENHLFSITFEDYSHIFKISLTYIPRY